MALCKKQRHTGKRISLAQLSTEGLGAVHNLGKRTRGVIMANQAKMDWHLN